MRSMMLKSAHTATASVMASSETLASRSGDHIIWGHVARAEREFFEKTQRGSHLFIDRRGPPIIESRLGDFFPELDRRDRAVRARSEHAFVHA